MAVAKNDEELEEIASEEVAKKTKHELPFFKDIKPFLRSINDDFAQQYIADGTVIDANEYKATLIGLLFKNYKKISKDFKNTIRESFDEKVSVEVDAKINSDINKFLKDLGDRRSDLILDTTNKEIANELSKTVSEFIEEEKEIVNTEIAKETKKKLNKKVDGRAAIIAISETQTTAESTKNIEKNVLSVAGIVLGGVAIKTNLRDIWITTLDERTRPAHAAANLQPRQADGFFYVGGERLRYPGDSNGSPGNIINCRCSVVKKII